MISELARLPRTKSEHLIGSRPQDTPDIFASRYTWRHCPLVYICLYPVVRISFRSLIYIIPMSSTNIRAAPPYLRRIPIAACVATHSITVHHPCFIYFFFVLSIDIGLLFLVSDYTRNICICSTINLNLFLREKYACLLGVVASRARTQHSILVNAQVNNIIFKRAELRDVQCEEYIGMGRMMGTR